MPIRIILMGFLLIRLQITYFCSLCMHKQVNCVVNNRMISLRFLIVKQINKMHENVTGFSTIKETVSYK